MGAAHSMIHEIVQRRSVAVLPRTKLWPRFALTYAICACVVACVVWVYDPTLFVTAPALALLAAALSVAVSFATGGQAWVHERFSGQNFVQHNEVGGFIIAVAGTLYAVVLGFLTVVAWQHFAEARQLVALESAAATDTWHAGVGLPPAVRSRVRRDALDYSNAMVSIEWPRMREGRFDTGADYIVMDAITAAGTFRPSNFMESNSQNATLQQLSVLHDVRQERLADNESAISGFEWLVLLLGAACITAFCWLFGMLNARVHLLMTAVVAVLTASVLVLLFELQYPFRTDLRIAPASWNASIEHIHLMQDGPQHGMQM